MEYTINNMVQEWLEEAAEGYGPDLEADVKAFAALRKVADLHEGCRHCNNGRPCREIAAIAEALDLIEPEG